MLGLEPQQLRTVDQELKEAVCAAIVSMTIERVSGSGEAGRVLYGPSPRRSIISGQLLPRFDQNQVDDTSDIRIAAIGMDFQVHAEGSDQATASPVFSVYVRVLPDWDELIDEDLQLDIEFDLKDDIQEAIDARMRILRKERFATAGVATPDWSNLTPRQKQDVRATRDKIIGEVLRDTYGEHGIKLETADTKLLVTVSNSDGPSEDEENNQDDEEQEAKLKLGRLVQRGRSIPFGLLEPAGLPAKWRRLTIELPIFQWPLTSGADALEERLLAYSVELRTAAEAQVKKWLESSEGRRDAWRDIEVHPQDITSPEAWNAFRDRAEQLSVPISKLLPKIDEIALQIDRVVDYLDPSRASVRVALDNRTAELSRRDARSRCDALFEVRLTVRLPSKSHTHLRLDRVESSYRFRHFLDYPAIGLNCGIVSQPDGEDTILKTSWAPEFVQPRIVPRKLDIPTTFLSLSDEAFDIGHLLTLPNEYRAWVEDEAKRLRDVVGDGLGKDDAELERERLKSDVAAQLAEADYIARGIALLQESQKAYRDLPAAADKEKRARLEKLAAPYRAWVLTNQSFLRREKNSSERGWHLFQLAFVLAHVPTLASRMDEYKSYQDQTIDEVAASLLYFPTGGGKSEAFYGALLYAMFLDRLRGKQRGVTAMIRYPLRLLTLQQGQRLLKLTVQAEIIRRENKVGDWPFEIGFWVGGNNTPNRYAMVPAFVPPSSDELFPNDELLQEGARGLTDEQRRDAQRYRDFSSAYNKVPECPVCGAATGLRRFTSEGPTAERLGIICFNKQCAYSKVAGASYPLPFLLTDDAIYARAPSVVLGTIDKMAMLGQHPSTIRHLLGMFGLARGIGPTGHLYSPRLEGDIAATLTGTGRQAVFPTFRKGVRVFFDPFPSLIIQDEAHLLEESLGTFSGLFDTLLETTFRKIDEIAGRDLEVARVWSAGKWAAARMPKIIAATATISNPDRQLEVLYQRKALRFPCPGSDIYRSFFAEPAPPPSGNADRVRLSKELPSHSAPERTAPWMRLFVSLMTNDATHTVTVVSVLSAFHTVITSLWRALLDPQKQAWALNAIRAHQGDGPSSDWRRAAVDRAISQSRESEVMALVDLHRIALSYVTNKKGGDQIMDALDSAVRLRHRRSHQPLDRFTNRLISGGIDIKDIQEIMKQAETSNANASYPEIVDTVRSIVATSAISHGVDVDRFNSMFFAGLPSDIAEYIQASSRVGRTHVGFVFLIPTPQSRRDRYVVETHDIFHRFLERMIAPPAVERWAENAIRRVMASLVQTWAILKEDELLLRAADDAKDRADSYELISPVYTLAKRDSQGFSDDLGSFVLRAIGYEGRGDAHCGRPVYQELYRALVDQEVTRFALKMRNLNTPLRLNEYWKESGAAFKPPMTSLRDVDEAGVITAGAFDMSARHGSRRIALDELLHVMRAIRNQKGAVAETDQDGPGVT